MHFLLFSTGPLYRFYHRVGLVKANRAPSFRRVFWLCLFTWLPLLLFTLISPLKLTSFIYAIDIHVRLLISLALLLYAESIANDRFQVVANHFLTCQLISQQDLPKYNGMLKSALRWGGSYVAELLLFLLVILLGPWVSQYLMSFDIVSWSAVLRENKMTLTLPGYWYIFISLPIFQFIFLRWCYRIVIWYRFLWQVSRLKLQLDSLHPDRSGGLGFLVNSVYALEPFIIACSFLLTGFILTSILTMGTTLWQYENEILSWIFILVLLPLLPLSFFSLKLARTKREGTNEYDLVANYYARHFRQKWIKSFSDHKEKLLGTSDIQSLADLTNSYTVSAGMRIIPVSKNTLLTILLCIALPLFPLILTVIPLQDIFKQMMGIIF